MRLQVCWLAVKSFWPATITKFELDDHDFVILREVCRTIDLLDSLQVLIERDGAVLKWGDGVRANPAVSELRQHRLVLARLVTSLGIPPDPDHDRPALRGGGARGVYRPARR
jgi:hypothetical protein